MSSQFNALAIALAKANVQVTTPTPSPAKSAPCAGATKAGQNHPVAGSDVCQTYQAVTTPIVPETEAPTNALAALRAAVAAAKAEAARRAKAKAEVKAKALAQAARTRRLLLERDSLLRRVTDLGAAMADAEAEYERQSAPLAGALAEARRLGDLVPAEVVEAAQAEADALREKFNLAQKRRQAELRRLQVQVTQIEEHPLYRMYLDILNALRRKGLGILARANNALNAKDYAAAERLAAKLLRQKKMPEDIRERAEKFIDVVRYQREQAKTRAAARAERRRRRQPAKWFAAAEKARQEGDFIIAVGMGQFAHLRPIGKNRWDIVSALGYEPPKQYRGSLPKHTRRVWRQVVA